MNDVAMQRMAQRIGQRLCGTKHPLLQADDIASAAIAAMYAAPDYDGSCSETSYWYGRGLQGAVDYVRTIYGRREKLTQPIRMATQVVFHDPHGDDWRCGSRQPHSGYMRVPAVHDQHAFEAWPYDQRWRDAVLAALDERERLILIASLWLDIPQKNLAKMLSVTDARISQIKQDALNKLRAYMEEHYEILLADRAAARAANGTRAA